MQFTKGETTKSFKNLNAQIDNNLYEFLNVANRIVNEEVTNCEFDSSEYFENNPDIKVDKFKTEDGSTIYTIKTDNDFFRFALRGGCQR